jgi:HK97 family phage major capsid protein
MSTKLEGLRDKQAERVQKMEALVGTAEAEGRDLSDTEQELFKALNAEGKSIQGQIECEQELLARRAEMEKAQKVPVVDTVVPRPQPLKIDSISAGSPNEILPARIKRWGNLHSFKGPTADVQAYKAGMFYLACFGSDTAKAWLKERGIPIHAAAQTEGLNTAGGYLVYDELDNAIIDLRDSYGVFTRNARRVAMASDVKIRPRRTGGLTASFVGEDTAITESSKTWDKVELTAKKMGVTARISNELSEDAIINVADDLTKEIAWAYSKKIDECGFIGTGALTYGGIVGVSPRLTNLNGADEGGGLIKSANNTYAEITLAEMTRVISILPTYAQARAKWYCSTLLWGQCLMQLTTAGGGNTIRDLEGGETTRQFLGYPVEITTVMPTTAANSQLCILFGDLALAADFGDRRQMTVTTSEAAVIGGTSVFERDEIGLRGTMRFDINVHDVGTASAAGPMVGLILHSA